MNETSMFYGFFSHFNLAISLLISLATVVVLGYSGAPLLLWTVGVGLILVGFNAPIALLIVFAAVAVVFNLRPLRAMLVSSALMKMMKAMGFLPTISPTERTALDAGVVWVEGDLFSGKPNFNKLMKEPYPQLTQEEKAFLDGPVEKLCEIIDEWRIWKERELPPEVWAYLKRERFFGMIIPKKYGGHEFSAYAHSEIIMKLATRSVPTTITTMVPNSLGPAELLIHYGTQQQKDYYLPRLARGEEIPCFALTEPTAGSDAGAIQSSGVLFKGDDGKLYIQLNWNKRWITLAAISTILGLAFKLRDPDGLIGKEIELGITCALIPTNTKGVVLGRRHDPLGVPFYNCPTQGHNVIIPADNIIGGIAMAGKGWGMLMESLGAGRGVSIPAQSVGGAKMATRVVSAHASIRKQFGIAIGKFEGIEEPLSRIAGYTYLLEAFRVYTLSALDQGIKPPVITAIAKYHSSEIGRKMLNDAMDIMGGAGISRGPRNLIANFYYGAPISVTVEGANILTRTLMIFGQGALRAHPFAYKEISALEKGDLKEFDKAFWGHVGHVIRNCFRSVVLSLTRGYAAFGVPGDASTRRHYQKLMWVSASFAAMADFAMAFLGGRLKQKEMITGRFADILSWLYISTAILRRYEADGRKKEDLRLVHWGLQCGFIEMQRAFDGIFTNLKAPGLSWVFNGILRVWSALNPLATQISDQSTHKVAELLLENMEARDRITRGIYIPKDPNDHVARLERVMKIVKGSEEAERKIRRAVRDKKLPKKKIFQLFDEAKQLGVISAQEYAHLQEAETARLDAIQVDDFSQEQYHSHTGSSQTEGGASGASSESPGMSGGEKKQGHMVASNNPL